MRDADERTASLALRDGGPAALRRAIGWYRTHDRLNCGDEITMASDALASYRYDIAVGKDALLVCGTTEMANALKMRLHEDAVASGAPIVIGARGHRLAVGDLILTRRNGISVPLHHNDNAVVEHSPVRNGQRWKVTHVLPEKNRLVARRIDDGALGAFTNDYVRQHITYGYAATVHSAQGTTAETTHAVLGSNATRALTYVALTRGRGANTVYLYPHSTEQDRELDLNGPGHLAQRGGSKQAAILLREVTSNDDSPATAHNWAARAPIEPLPAQVSSAIERQASAARERTRVFVRWRDQASSFYQAAQSNRGRDFGADRSMEEGLEY